MFEKTVEVRDIFRLLLKGNRESDESVMLLKEHCEQINLLLNETMSPEVNVPLETHFTSTAVSESVAYERLNKGMADWY